MRTADLLCEQRLCRRGSLATAAGFHLCFCLLNKYPLAILPSKNSFQNQLLTRGRRKFTNTQGAKLRSDRGSVAEHWRTSGGCQHTSFPSHIPCEDLPTACVCLDAPFALIRDENAEVLCEAVDLEAEECFVWALTRVCYSVSLCPDVTHGSLSSSSLFCSIMGSYSVLQFLLKISPFW